MKTTSSQKKKKQKNNSIWVILRDQGWGALIKKKKRKSSSKKSSLKLKIIMLLVWLITIFTISLGCFIWYCNSTLPDFSKALYVERSNGIKILSSNNQEITSYGALFSKPITIDELPPFIPQAFVDTEDRRFYKHSGFDYIGFIRAMGVNLVKMRYAQGASTITQQVAKNLFLTRDKSIKRKVQEYILASKLEKHFSKKQILEIYLNRVFFGYGAYGLNSASKRYFNKQAKDLNLKEVAILAGSLKAPSKYNYFANKELALKRAKTVLNLMTRAGTLTKQQKEDALKLDVQDKDKGLILGGRYFGDYVLSKLDDILSDNFNEDIYVKTTLDYNLQQRAEYILRKNLRQNSKNNVKEGAVVILDKTGAIKAMAGGFNYEKSQFNRATLATRPAGSSFKLFVYLSALEKGFDLNELISDEPIKIDNWEPQNYDKKFRGAVTLKEAFAKSLNAATVDLATYTSLNEIINMAHRLGITTPITNHPAITLGAVDVKVIDMATSYNVIHNGGFKSNPYVIDKIYNTHDELLYEHNIEPKEQLLSKEVVNKAKILLREVVTNGTGSKAKSIKNAHAKTGTSQNYRDAWFVGFNDKYTTAVWVGNDNNESMKNITGGSLPATIWQEIMK